MKSIFDLTGCYDHRCEHLILTESDKQSLLSMHTSLQNSFGALSEDQQSSSYFAFPIISEIRAVEHVMEQLTVDYPKWQQPSEAICE
jgi:FlaA1/EpsC-like NDP-sugar epimerase